MWLKRTLAIDSRVLLAYYAIIPALIVIAGLDHYFFHSAIRDFLPKKPETYLWWVLVFNLPHIMASLVTYAEPAYLAAYKKPLGRGMLVALALTFFIPILFGEIWLFVFGACYTMYHVLMQQYGISLMLLRKPADFAFKAFQWLSIIGTSFMYLAVYYPPIAHILPSSLSLDGVGTMMVVASIPFGLYVMARVLKSDASATSKAYFVGTFFMIGVSAMFYHTGYLFFMFLIPRFVHDATAFTVYAVHDHNRNLEVRHNVIYRALKPLHIPPAILCLPVGIAIAWVFSSNMTGSLVMAACVSIFSFLHYYMEGHMWKRGTLHRQYAPFHVV